MNTITTEAAPKIEWSRGSDGKQPLKAVTKIDLGFERRLLIIESFKNAFRPGIESKAKVVQISDDGHFEIHRMRAMGQGDFAVVLASDPGARGTQKALLDMHSKALASVNQLIEQAVAHCKTVAEQAAASDEG